MKTDEEENTMTDDEVCRVIIALANLVYIENRSHDIKLVKEKK